jgi:acyl-CoA thioesterase
MGNLFLDSTQVQRVAPYHYEGAVDEEWNLRPLPQGGIVTALALRAMADTLDNDAERLRTLHTAFVAQVADGPVVIETELLRRGRSMSHLRAEVKNPDAARGHVTTAIFGTTRRGFDFTDLAPPTEIPRPEDCTSFREPPPEDLDWVYRDTMPFWDSHVEGRSVFGHAPWDRYEPDRAERIMWYRFDEPPFLDDGTMDPFALVVLADTMPGAVGERVGSSQRDWFAPSIDLTVHLLDDCRSPWLLAHNRARHAGDGYASADMALWDCGPDGTGTPRLVAYGTQLFLFSFVD